MKFTQTCLCLLAMSGFAAHAGTISFSDGFEGGAINPFWTVSQASGSVSLTTAQAHSGSQSVQFASTSAGGQRTMLLSHSFASGVTGTFSVFFYDAAPGQQTLYQQISVESSTNSVANMNLGTQDFDAFCYMNVSNGVGPNANCGVFPQTSTTSVVRTLGWHELRIVVSSTSIAGFIDGFQTYAQSGSGFSIDRVNIFMSGPAFRPNTTAYFDDFNMVAEEVPEPSTILSLGFGLLALMCMRRPRPFKSIETAEK